MDYNATLTIHVNKPATEDDDIDDVMEAFASYHPAVGDAPACPGALKAVITLPAHTLTQAVATATALAAQVGDLVGIEVIPTRMWDRREGLKIDDVEFVGVSEAASLRRRCATALPPGACPARRSDATGSCPTPRSRAESLPALVSGAGGTAVQPQLRPSGTGMPVLPSSG